LVPGTNFYRVGLEGYFSRGSSDFWIGLGTWTSPESFREGTARSGGPFGQAFVFKIKAYGAQFRFEPRDIAWNRSESARNESLRHIAAPADFWQKLVPGTDFRSYMASNFNSLEIGAWHRFLI
jgi:hypothetical protein